MNVTSCIFWKTTLGKIPQIDVTEKNYEDYTSGKEFELSRKRLSRSEWIEPLLRKTQAIPPIFLVRKFFVRGQFIKIFGKSTQKSTETVWLRKISHHEIRWK